YHHSKKGLYTTISTAKYLADANQPSTIKKKPSKSATIRSSGEDLLISEYDSETENMPEDQKMADYEEMYVRLESEDEAENSEEENSRGFDNREFKIGFGETLRHPKKTWREYKHHKNRRAHDLYDTDDYAMNRPQEEPEGEDMEEIKYFNKK